MTSANTTGPAGSAASRDATRRSVGVLRRLLQRPELASLGGLVAAFAVFSILRPDLFLTQDNGINVASLAAQYGIVAVGVTLLMIAGHFDLSVGTIVGLTGWAMYYFGNVLGLPPIVTILSTLAFGTLLGAVNGVIQVRTGLPSFIITLATSLVYRGILTMNTSGFPVVVKFPASYAQVIAGKHLFGYRMSLLWFLVVAVLATLFLLRTRMGNWAFAIGQNPTAAKNLGVPVARTTVTLFALSGFTSGVAGVVVAVQYFSIDANRGVGWELIAIAMTVIGGTLLTGGYGSVLGTVLGAFMYAMVNAGLLLIGLQGYWVNIFLGIVVLVAVLINRVVIDRFVMSPNRTALEQPIIVADEAGARGRAEPILRRHESRRDPTSRRDQARRRVARCHDEFPIGDGAAQHLDRGPRGQGAGAAWRQRRRQEHADQGALGRLPTHLRFRRSGRAPGHVAQRSRRTRGRHLDGVPGPRCLRPHVDRPQHGARQ